MVLSGRPSTDSWPFTIGIPRLSLQETPETGHFFGFRLGFSPRTQAFSADDADFFFVRSISQP